jgi:hypothetical protein
LVDQLLFPQGIATPAAIQIPATGEIHRKDEGTSLMLNLIGPTDDHFAVLASPSDHDTYNLLIYPEIPESPQHIDVPSAKLMTFLESRQDTIEALGGSGTSGLFIHSLTEADVRELTSERGKPGPCRLH